MFIGLACLQVAAASLILLNRDGDLPRHIAVGKVMLASGALLRDDLFSHTAHELARRAAAAQKADPKSRAL